MDSNGGHSFSTPLIRLLLDATADGLLLTDGDDNILEQNSHLARIWRLDPGWSWNVASNSAARLWSKLSLQSNAPELFLEALAKAGSDPVEGVGSLDLRDGRRIDCHSQPCRLSDGRIGRTWCFRDLTAIDRTEGDVKQERERFRVTLSSIGDAVITTDINGQVTFLNPVAERMTGWSQQEARGQPLTTVFHIINELTRELIQDPVSRVLTEGIVIGLANHTALISRDGRETAIEDSAAPIRDEKGTIVGAVRVFHDVDARRKAERAVQRNERLLADFFEHAPVGLNWIGPDGRLVRVNRAELQLLGYSEADYVGRSWIDAHAEPEVGQEILSALTRGERVENRSARLLASDGTIKEVLISANVFREEGHFVHARCFTRDVTEHNRAEAARADFVALVASSEDAIISKSLEGVVLSWNRGAQRVFGYSAEEMVGQPILRLIPSDRRAEEPAILERLKKGERIEHYETVRQRKDGTLLDVSLTVSPIRDAHGRIVSASKIARDITANKNAERLLREEYAITEQLYNVAQALASELELPRIVQLITDAGTRITRAQFGAFFYNRVDEHGESYSLYTLSGVDRSAFEKFPMPRATHLFGPTFRGEGVLRLADVRKDPRFGQNALHHGMPAGHLPVVSYLAVPVSAHSGEVLGGLFFGHSEPSVFTERDEKMIVAVAAQAAAAMNSARLFEAERHARTAAEEANRSKDHFIAALSHELRTPLTPVLAILSHLRGNPEFSPAIAADLETARRNVVLEARLIDDLLDITRISRGKLQLQEEVVLVEGLIETAVTTCRVDLEARELNLIRDLRAASAAVLGDSARITQVLWNLLKNAVKFTPDGGTITVRSHIRRSDKGSEIVVEVKDNGIGIEAEHLPRIFSAFDQGGQNITQRFGGLGLGLAISKAIVDAHRGRLTAASEGHGHGATFTLVLPLIPRERAFVLPPRLEPGLAESEAAAAATRPLRILLVEDHHDSAAVLQRLFSLWGHTVLYANSVADGLRVAEMEMKERGLDLLISDLGLPDGSGLDLMRTLSGRHKIQGIALSGFGMAADREQSAAAGFARHLIKPVDTNLLRIAIHQVAEGRKAD